MNNTKEHRCVICGSKKNLIQHHKVHLIVRDVSDETTTLCRRCHVDVHEAYHDSLRHHWIENVGCCIYPVHKPRKFFGLREERKKKKVSTVARKEEIALYWAIYHYSYVDDAYGYRAIKQSVIRL